jgi:hypothetical protein
MIEQIVVDGMHKLHSLLNQKAMITNIKIFFIYRFSNKRERSKENRRFSLKLNSFFAFLQKT